MSPASTSEKNVSEPDDIKETLTRLGLLQQDTYHMFKKGLSGPYIFELTIFNIENI